MSHPSQANSIIVTKYSLVVDGEEIPTVNRWEAKRKAKKLARQRGTSWWNLKANGELVEMAS